VDSRLASQGEHHHLQAPGHSIRSQWWQEHMAGCGPLGALLTFRRCLLCALWAEGSDHRLATKSSLKYTLSRSRVNKWSVFSLERETAFRSVRVTIYTALVPFWNGQKKVTTQRRGVWVLVSSKSQLSIHTWGNCTSVAFGCDMVSSDPFSEQHPASGVPTWGDRWSQGIGGRNKLRLGSSEKEGEEESLSAQDSSPHRKGRFDESQQGPGLENQRWGRNLSSR
jgi:hypothetical protein